MVIVIRKRQGGRTGLGKSNEFNCECAEFEVPMDIQVAFDIIIKKPVAFLSCRKDYDH